LEKAGGLSALDAHIVPDALDPLDVARQRNRSDDVLLRAHKAAQLNFALEGLDIDFGGLQVGLIENCRLDPGRDPAVIEVFARTFLRTRLRAADKGHHEQGQRCVNERLEAAHWNVLRVKVMTTPLRHTQGELHGCRNSCSGD
jgi:hypothetical protein